MRTLILLMALAATGCANAEQQVRRGFAVAERGLKGVDVALDVAGSGYAAAYATVEAACREKLGDDSTQEERAHCTRAFANADEIANLTEKAARLYDEAADLLDELEAAALKLAAEAQRAKGAVK